MLCQLCEFFTAARLRASGALRQADGAVAFRRRRSVIHYQLSVRCSQSKWISSITLHPAPGQEEFLHRCCDGNVVILRVFIFYVIGRRRVPPCYRPSVADCSRPRGSGPFLLPGCLFPHASSPIPPPLTAGRFSNIHYFHQGQCNPTGSAKDLAGADKGLAPDTVIT